MAARCIQPEARGGSSVEGRVCDRVSVHQPPRRRDLKLRCACAHALVCSRVPSRALVRVLPYPSFQDAGPGSGRSALSASQSRSGVGRQDSASELSELESTATRRAESGARRAGRAMDHGTNCLSHPPALINHRKSLVSRQCRQTDPRWDAGCTRTGHYGKRSRGSAEARSRIFDGRAVQSRGACSPGSAGPRRVWFASLALGSWAAESPPEPASFFQADGSEAAANAANDSASVSGGREVRGQFRLRAQLASPSSPNCRAPRKGRLDRLPAGQAWYPANSPGDSDRRSLLARCVDPAAARKCVGQTRQG